MNECLYEKPNQLNDFFQFKTLVVGSHRKECSAQFVREAKNLNLSVHDLTKEALEIQLK